ncbi:hypothetical protein PCANC_02148 [Puccinia coronata f. sp. avenae]|uniref:Uncharacterized protein n=1 Tax=Puccinia coronata f. sp. avenae TaxID=200324 RepID=A0A2N5W009_9BASI|nr:hypothetical protein PCASD_23207 [Puccinia coronata f. sp. avenae]PLW15375.1 hypothetical protein PCANC_20479 [Puccinia coronata f. sp. avenae]PLW33924.1 hypothetical protein PCASD_13864 [Puccinia coronata f. sp. avenae]PLW39138.1 hypothetical protein PCANC_12610 [Puccinia coronata f. sp. avenae]PLW55550.1 hypothetical protein PCANC_02148 [Puccinia coronata f. sp. avenae]
MSDLVLGDETQRLVTTPPLSTVAWNNNLSCSLLSAAGSTSGPRDLVLVLKRCCFSCISAARFNQREKNCLRRRPNRVKASSPRGAPSGFTEPSADLLSPQSPNLFEPRE